MDLADGFDGFSDYDIRGFLGASEWFWKNGFDMAAGAFTTISRVDSGAVVGRLEITVHKNPTSFYNIDNIRLSAAAAVPVPASLALVGLALVGLALVAMALAGRRVTL